MNIENFQILLRMVLKIVAEMSGNIDSSLLILLEDKLIRLIWLFSLLSHYTILTLLKWNPSLIENWLRFIFDCGHDLDYLSMMINDKKMWMKL